MRSMTIGGWNKKRQDQKSSVTGSIFIRVERGKTEINQTIQFKSIVALGKRKGRVRRMGPVKKSDVTKGRPTDRRVDNIIYGRSTRPRHVLFIY